MMAVGVVGTSIDSGRLWISIDGIIGGNVQAIESRSKEKPLVSAEHGCTKGKGATTGC